ncbi:MAG: hypothetical protein QM594_09635 [Niabella sp.]
MTKPEINNYEDLMAEKKRLKARLRASKAGISYSFEAIKQEVNPFSGIKKNAGGIFQSGTTNPLVKFGIRRASEFLIRKILLKRAGWLPRLIVPFLVREAAVRIIGAKTDKKIAHALRDTAGKIRKAEIPDLSGEKSSGK